MLTLTFIAYDRYYAICKPLQFNARSNKAVKVIGGIWTIAGIISIPNFSLVSKSPFDKDGGVAYNPCISDDVFFDLSGCSSNWSKDIDFIFMVTKVRIQLSQNCVLRLSFMILKCLLTSLYSYLILKAFLYGTYFYGVNNVDFLFCIEHTHILCVQE